MSSFVFYLLTQDPVPSFDDLEELLVARHGSEAFELFEDEISARHPDFVVPDTTDGVWLVKAAEGVGRARRRFFVLQPDHRLAYYARLVNARPEDRKGVIVIHGATTFEAQGRTLLVTQPQRQFELRAASPEVAEAWRAKLAAAKKAFMSDIKRRAAEAVAAGGVTNMSTLRERLSPHYDEEAVNSAQEVLQPMLQVDASGTAAIAERAVAAGDDDDDDDEGDYQDGASAITATGAVQMSGWLTKAAEKRGKSRRRFFELLDTKFIYYKTELANGRGSRPLGVIPLSLDMRVSKVAAMLVLTSPAREWRLTAESATVAGQWEDALLRVRAGVLESLRARFRATTVTAGEQASLPELYAAIWADMAGSVTSVGHDKLQELVVEYLGQQLDSRAMPKVFGLWFFRDKHESGARRYLQHSPGELRCYRECTDQGPRELEDTLVLSSDTQATVSTPAGGRPVLVVDNGRRAWTLVQDQPNTAQQMLFHVLFVEQGRHPDLAASTDADGAADIAAAPAGPPDVAGWFLKRAENRGKDHRRFFVLRGTEVAYFAEELDGRGVDQRGSFSIDLTTELKPEGRQLHVVTAT